MAGITGQGIDEILSFLGEVTKRGYEHLPDVLFALDTLTKENERLACEVKRLDDGWQQTNLINLANSSKYIDVATALTKKVGLYEQALKRINGRCELNKHHNVTAESCFNISERALAEKE